MTDINARHLRDAIKSVRTRWEDQYSHCPPEYEIGHRENREPVGVIRKRLRALDLDTCTVADVDKAIGTDGWAVNECDICGTNVPITVHLQSRFSDDRALVACKKCLNTAAKLAAKKPRL